MQLSTEIDMLFNVISNLVSEIVQGHLAISDG